MQDRHQVLLQHRLEINEHVAAAGQIYAGKWWILEDVVFGEHAHIPNGLRHTVLSVEFVEIATQPFRRIRRSEEHTSELQSRSDLVCRLLLEKKKKQVK